MPLYGIPTHPDDAKIKTEKKTKHYPQATAALIWMASPVWGGFTIGWLAVLGFWPDLKTSAWIMLGITYAITWIVAWITRWYYEDNYATHTGKPLHQVITGW